MTALNTTRGPAKPAPGPRGHFFLGSLPERRADPLNLYMRGALEYGEVVRYKMGPMRVHLVTNPDHVKHVLLDNQKNYFKGWGSIPCTRRWATGYC